MLGVGCSFLDDQPIELGHWRCRVTLLDHILEYFSNSGILAQQIGIPIESLRCDLPVRAPSVAVWHVPHHVQRP